MPRGGRLLALAAVAAALLAAYLALRTPEEAFRAEEAPAPQSTYEMLYERPLPSFRSLTVDLPRESYTLQSALVYDKDGALLGVDSAQGQPLSVAGEPEFCLEDTAWQVMLVAAQHLPVTNRWEGLDAAACGLKTPLARLTIRYDGQEDIVLLVGRLISPALGCYVQRAGEEAVYAAPADFYDAVTRPLTALHFLPGAAGEAASQAVQAALIQERAWILTRQSRPGSMAAWQITSPFVHDASAAAVERFVSGVCALRAEAYAATVEGAEGLARYGLDTPTRLAVSFSDGAIRDISLGGDAGEGRVYARMDRSGDIYLLGREQLRFLEDCAPNALLEAYVYLVSSEQVRTLDIAWPGGGCVLARQAAADGDGEARYFVDGREVTPADYSALYAAAIGITLDDVAPQEESAAEPKLTLRYLFEDGTEQTVTYCPYDEFYDLARAEGCCFLVRSRQREALVGKLETWKEENP